MELQIIKKAKDVKNLLLRWEELLNEFRKIQDKQFICVYKNKEMVGACILYILNRELWISDVYQCVNQYSNNDIGRIIVNTAIQQGRALGERVLYSKHSNWLKTFGFQSTCGKDDCELEGCNVMVRTL